MRVQIENYRLCIRSHMNNSKILWMNIDWKRCTHRINKIQERIFNASLKGDKNTVRFLQNVLIHSLDAKLLAVKRVTTDNSGKKTPGLDGLVYLSPVLKMRLVRSLRVDGRAAPIRRVWIPKPGILEKRPLAIPIIRDRAKQKLVLMALEPEWEAKFEANSYGFRPGRSIHDAAEAIFRNIRNASVTKSVFRKYVLDADLKGCFENINHVYLIKKLEASPLISTQVEAWLKAGIFEGLVLSPDLYDEVPENQLGTPQGGPISPFLANVALHGMEDFLNDWIKTQTWPVEKRHQLFTANKIKSLGFIRYADDFVIIHTNKDLLVRAQEALAQWLLIGSGLRFNVRKTRVVDSTQGFNFVGFSFINVVKNGISRAKIYPSEKNVSSLLKKVGDRCRKFRALSSYDLIRSLRPILIGWVNNFRFVECKDSFVKIDRLVYNIIRAWVFRRDRRSGRMIVKEKYFPSGKSFMYQGVVHKNNWVLCGQKRLPGGILVENHLPKMAWIKSAKFVSVKGNASVYDGNDAYWALRSQRYGGFSTRQRTLLQRQNGKCALCQGLILDKIVQVDQIIPLSKGGKDMYSNLQLLHTQCQTYKSRLDASSLDDANIFSKEKRY